MSILRPWRSNDCSINRPSANWSDNERGQSGFFASKFSITRAWPQANSLFRFPNFSYSSLYFVGPINTTSTRPIEFFRIASAKVRIRASELIRLLSCDHEGPEEITLAAFVHAEMRLEHFWRVHFFVAKLRFTQNFWFQLELHKFFHALALNEHLWPFLVNRHAQFIFLTKEKRVLLRGKFETQFVQERTKFACLIFCQEMGVRIHSQKT